MSTTELEKFLKERVLDAAGMESSPLLMNMLKLAYIHGERNGMMQATRVITGPFMEATEGLKNAAENLEGGV